MRRPPNEFFVSCGRCCPLQSITHQVCHMLITRQLLSVVRWNCATTATHHQWCNMPPPHLVTRLLLRSDRWHFQRHPTQQAVVNWNFNRWSASGYTFMEHNRSDGRFCVRTETRASKNLLQTIRKRQFWCGAPAIPQPICLGRLETISCASSIRNDANRTHVAGFHKNLLWTLISIERKLLEIKWKKYKR